MGKTPRSGLACSDASRVATALNLLSLQAISARNRLPFARINFPEPDCRRVKRYLRRQPGILSSLLACGLNCPQRKKTRITFLDTRLMLREADSVVTVSANRVCTRTN